MQSLDETCLEEASLNANHSHSLGRMRSMGRLWGCWSGRAGLTPRSTNYCSWTKNGLEQVVSLPWTSVFVYKVESSCQSHLPALLGWIHEMKCEAQHSSSHVIVSTNFINSHFLSLPWKVTLSLFCGVGMGIAAKAHFLPVCLGSMSKGLLTIGNSGVRNIHPQVI